MRNSISKRPSVLRRVGVSKTTLATMIANKEFPSPIKLSSKAIGWIDSEIDAWFSAKVAERDADAAANAEALFEGLIPPLNAIGSGFEVAVIPATQHSEGGSL